MKDIRRMFLSAYLGPTNYMSDIVVKYAFIAVLVDRDPHDKNIGSSLQNRGADGAIPFYTGDK